VLKISPNTVTVIETLKKHTSLQSVNKAASKALEPTQTIVRLCLAENADLAADVDEMWSFVEAKAQQRWLWWAINFVEAKAQQRWLWWAINPETGEVLAYVFRTQKMKRFYS
jgi:hypothetical protein